MNSELKKYVEGWLEKGNKDLLTAQRLIEKAKSYFEVPENIIPLQLSPLAEYFSPDN